MATHTAATAAVAEAESSPHAIVAWALRRFAGRNLVLTTSFGMEGCALIEMIARHGVEVPVI
jgi:3'-phosphoadenosine 5'-phosphosulfate sulfotransferase (PAPS reductase)/FAD synthetase